MSASTLQFKVLFTRHKTQKRKRYEDGVLVVQRDSRRADLFGCDPTAEDVPVGNCRDSIIIDASVMGVDPGVALIGCELDFEKFTVEVEHLQHTTGDSKREPMVVESHVPAMQQQHQSRVFEAQPPPAASRKGSFCLASTTTNSQSVPQRLASDVHVMNNHEDRQQQQQQDQQQQGQQQQAQRSVGGSFGSSSFGRHSNSNSNSRLKLRGGRSQAQSQRVSRDDVMGSVYAGHIENNPLNVTSTRRDMLDKQGPHPEHIPRPRRTTEQLIRLFESPKTHTQYHHQQ
jgi:hypothetical protein